MAFGIPLAIYALVRFLETQRGRYLVALVATFWIQAASVWYYAVILSFGLGAVVPQFLALRWGGWRPRTLLVAALGGLALLGALVPLAAPYFLTRAELGLERSLADAIPRSANLGSFVEARANWLYRVFTAERAWEAVDEAKDRTAQSVPSSARLTSSSGIFQSFRRSMRAEASFARGSAWIARSGGSRPGC